MHKFLLFIFFTFLYASDINNQLLDFLYDETGWILDENLEDGSVIYVKNNDNISLQAIKISRNTKINPLIILDIIKDVKNYNSVLTSSSNIVTTPIFSDNDIIAKHYISIPILSDLYYFFKIYESNNRVYWLLQNSDDYQQYYTDGYPLSIGCGGWDYQELDNGTYNVNYRLIFDIDGYPSWVVNYINYYSLLNVYNDVIAAAFKKDKKIKFK